MLLVKLSPGRGKRPELHLVEEKGLNKLLSRAWRIRRKAEVFRVDELAFTGRAIAVAGEWKLEKVEARRSGNVLDI